MTATLRSLNALAARLGLAGEVVRVATIRHWTLREQTRAAARGETLPPTCEIGSYAFRHGWASAQQGEDTLLGTSGRAAASELRAIASAR